MNYHSATGGKNKHNDIKNIIYSVNMTEKNREVRHARGHTTLKSVNLIVFYKKVV